MIKQHRSIQHRLAKNIWRIIQQDKLPCLHASYKCIYASLQPEILMSIDLLEIGLQSDGGYLDVGLHSILGEMSKNVRNYM